jgi:HD superfamily phosphohydrolase
MTLFTVKSALNKRCNHLCNIRWNVVDTRHYQRLRSLKQTGSVYFVYPGATHCRLEHSLGVGHLSSILLNQLLCTGTLFKEDYRASHFPVVLGAICHDLGHGPFSHLFDNMLIKSLE